MSKLPEIEVQIKVVGLDEALKEIEKLGCAIKQLSRDAEELHDLLPEQIQEAVTQLVG